MPFAGFDRTAKYEKNALLDYGFEEKNIVICDKTNIEAIGNMSFDYIYVPGGDTFKLLFELKESKLLGVIKKFIDNGGTYIGSSGGAYICCRGISYLKILEDNNYINDNDFSALGIIDENIICHADQYDYYSIARCRELVQDEKFIYITNTDVLVLEND